MADSQESAADPRKPRRRWLQISLRTLLILVTLLAAGLGLVVNPGERQRRAVAALEAIGGDVFYEEASSPAAKKSLGWRRWLPRDYFDDVQMVSLSGSKVTDACMVHLGALPQLQELYLVETRVTGAGLTQLQGLTRLQSLTLCCAQVTDAAVPQLQGLTNLRYLDLYRTQVTLEGITKLEDMLPNCQILY